MDIDTTTTVVKLENQPGNSNFHMYPDYKDPTPAIFPPRGTGKAPDPILVEALEEPVRDVFKAIDYRMKDWLKTNRHTQSTVTWNQQRTVRTTTYTNVKIVSIVRVSVTARFEIVID